MEENKESYKDRQKFTQEPEIIKCANCGNPGSWFTFKDNKIWLLTGTFRVWGTYKTSKGKTVNKDYAHYPSCEAIKIKEIVYRI